MIKYPRLYAPLDSESSVGVVEFYYAQRSDAMDLVRHVCDRQPYRITRYDIRTILVPNMSTSRRMTEKHQIFAHYQCLF